MLVLPGSQALSQFRLDKLLESLREEAPGACELGAQFVHLVDVAAPLDGAESSRLAELLEYGAPVSAGAGPGSSRALFFVTPRAGTVSPWSSKATDLAHVAGLGKVRRIERGIKYLLDPGDAPAAADRLSAHLHDRMTESVWRTIEEAAALFHDEPPRALRSVALRAGGRAALERVNRDWGLALSSDEIDYLV
jgi:phosphoribosylformylglycinamidine synthase